MKLFEKETYNDVIERMIEDSMQINDRTKKEIEQARKRVQAGKFVTMDAVAKKFGV